MTFLPRADNLDAFSRLRVATPASMADAQFEYDKLPILWREETTLGGSTAVHEPDTSSVLMTIGTGATADVTRQGPYTRYQPGKSLLAIFTGNFIGSIANVDKMIGRFDDSNGHFFLVDGSGLSVVERSNRTGSVVDTTIAQASFSDDELDGTGGSGFDWDLGNAQTMWIEQGWLGVGRVRMGIIDEGGEFLVAHVFEHANTLTVSYTETANLPMRYQMGATAGSAGATMRQMCSSVQSEGGSDPLGRLSFASRGTSEVEADTSLTPLVSFRLKTTHLHALIDVVSVSILTLDNQKHRWVLVYQPEANDLTGASWSDLDSASALQVDTSATALAGTAFELAGGYIGLESGAFQTVATDVRIDVDIAESGRDVMTLALQTTVGISDVIGGINIREVF